MLIGNYLDTFVTNEKFSLFFKVIFISMKQVHIFKTNKPFYKCFSNIAHLRKCCTPHIRMVVLAEIPVTLSFSQSKTQKSIFANRVKFREIT